MTRRYVVVGCGAVGGLYGARLAAGGNDVTFVVRSGAAELRDNGLRVDSVDGDIHLPPGTFGVATDMGEVGPPDVVILAVKTTSDVDLRALLGPHTTLAVFQNGLGVEQAADERSPGAGAVIGGMCFVCSRKVDHTHIRHEDYGLVTLAPFRGGLAVTEALGDDLRAAKVEVEVTADLVTARWRKLLWNVPFSGLTALLGVGTDELLAQPSGRALAMSLMDEVVAAAQACGASLGDDDIEVMVRRTEAMVPYLSSMAHDLAAGLPLEHDAIHGAAVRAGTEQGVPMARVEALWRALDVINPRLRTAASRRR
jgi:2-dehydropantoate 2-reductase